MFLELSSLTTSFHFSPFSRSLSRALALPFANSGSFTKGHRPCLGPRSIGSSSNAYSTAQGGVKTKRSYSNGNGSFRNSVLWCWSSRMTKLILCSFAFALVPGITYSSSNNDKLDETVNGKFTQREVKVQPDSFALSNSKDENTQGEHSTTFSSSFKTGIQVRRRGRRSSRICNSRDVNCADLF